MTRKHPSPDPKKATAYLRCSTHRQDLSPDAQRAAIAAPHSGSDCLDDVEKVLRHHDADQHEAHNVQDAA